MQTRCEAAQRFAASVLMDNAVHHFGAPRTWDALARLGETLKGIRDVAQRSIRQAHGGDLAEGPGPRQAHDGCQLPAVDLLQDRLTR